MSLSLYDVSVPQMISGLSALSGVLDLGETFAAEAGFNEQALLDTRLWPDMMSLASQVQRASDTAKFTAVRVGQAQNVPMSDNESSFEDLQLRIDATITFLRGVDPKGYDGRETVDVILPVPGKPVHYKGQEYVLDFAMPNFWFHVTTAYDILRSIGVPVGKRHYLGWE
jgi:hypothetical protein